MPNTLSTSCSKKSDTMCTGMLHSTQAHVFSDYLYFYTRNKTSFFSFHKNWRKNERKTKEKQELIMSITITDSQIYRCQLSKRWPLIMRRANLCKLCSYFLDLCVCVYLSLFNFLEHQMCLTNSLHYAST
jgi:hypothetical protein